MVTITMLITMMITILVDTDGTGRRGEGARASRSTQWQS
jgi:hypothetical protein